MSNSGMNRRERGIRIILDGVFNHVGRDFWAFRDLLDRRQASPYRDWFYGLTFEGSSPYGDPFAYEGWAGHYDLVKLNLHHPEVREHLLRAVEMWIQAFEIDGLRLDATDCLEPAFLRDLSATCRAQRTDFWLLGEVVTGDYRQWAQPEMLDSVTNYECYKGLYSSHVDANYYEIAYALNRQFGAGGIYAHLPLYNFCDNHDVHRVASNLTDPAHLYPLYCLLMTMPGVPSIYYGSEWGITGRKEQGSDRALRPHLNLAHMAQAGPHPALARAIARLTEVRHRSRALQYGGYRELHVGHDLLAFARQVDGECVVVAVNASDQPAALEIEVPVGHGDRLVDLLNPGESFALRKGRAEIDAVWPRWARILAVC